MKYWESLLPQQIIEIKYEELVDNPEESIKSLIKSCDLKWDERCLNFHNNKRPIKTASDAQARKKIYKSSLGISKKYSSDLRYVFNDLDS
jgi:hypothetical protein